MFDEHKVRRACEPGVQPMSKTGFTAPPCDLKLESNFTRIPGLLSPAINLQSPTRMFAPGPEDLVLTYRTLVHVITL